MVVENPQGVSGKYEVDTKLGIIGLDRVLAAPMPFPFEYGFIPGTWSTSDNDPLDIMVLLPIATFPGCVLHVRIIGLYRMVDTGQEDNKVLAVCDGDETYTAITDISDVPKRQLKRIAFFWENYKNLALRKSTEGHGWSNASVAEKCIEAAIDTYTVTFPTNEK